MSESKAVSLYDQSRLFSAPLPEGGAVVCRSEGMAVESDDLQRSGDLKVSRKDAVTLFMSAVFMISAILLCRFPYLSPGFDFAFFVSAAFLAIMVLFSSRLGSGKND